MCCAFCVTHCFACLNAQGQRVQLQHGVLRTNCIDCLDRTNVAQFAHGLTALGQQLHALGLADTPSIEAQSSAAHELMDMYEDMGNVLSRQVGPCYCIASSKRHVRACLSDKYTRLTGFLPCRVSAMPGFCHAGVPAWDPSFSEQLCLMGSCGG